MLTDNSGSITSRVAHLEVDPTFTKITTGAIVNSSGYGFGCAWGDYDGDGRTDMAIFRPAEGNFWINGTRSGVTVIGWGLNGDIPIENAYVR